MRRLSFAAALAILSSQLQAIDAQLDRLPSKPYDFVIVGGGTAGTVLANRLTENPKLNVLLIEAGPSHEGVLDIEVPAFARNLANSRFDWNFTTVPQAGLNGKTLAYERGHVLGGSSAVNNMAYTRGSADNYNKWAELTGDNGWSWQRLQPYIRKNERWVPPADNHNTTGEYDPRFHSRTGLNYVSLGSLLTFVDDKVIQTTKELKDEFPFNLDMNSGNPLGVGWKQNTIGNGERSNPADTYLHNFKRRSNLHILTDTTVTRVLPVGNSRKPDLRAVEVASGPTGPRTIITAKKEVILSGGSIGSVHILMNSGIGDEAELAEVGIKSVLHLPDVGKNLTDHPATRVTFATVSTNDQTWQNNATIFEQALAEWQTNRTGPLVQIFGHHIAFTRLPDNSSIFEQFPDPSSGRNTPHIEITIIASDSPSLNSSIVVVQPLSRGSIKLRTNNTFDAPLIDPQFLQSEYDIFVLREAIRAARRFYDAQTWQDFIVAELAPGPDVTSDDALDAYIRDTVSGFDHPVGTAAMSPKGASHGVVDPDLRLKNAVGLRVVDASVMPHTVCGHTQAAVYFIAERAADLIKASW